MAIVKINFPIDRNTYGEYCPVCHRKDVTFSNRQEAQEKVFICSGCGESSPRLIIIDPNIKWWLGEDGTYYHESVGILLFDSSEKILFYRLTKFPYGLTIPAGHVDVAETPAAAVIRETSEEVGLTIDSPDVCVSTDIDGDSCRRGSDNHRWTLYAIRIDDSAKSSLRIDNHEGDQPVWLGLNDVLEKTDQLPKAVSFLFGNFNQQIREAISNL